MCTPQISGANHQAERHWPRSWPGNVRPLMGRRPPEGATGGSQSAPWRQFRLKRHPRWVRLFCKGL